MAQLSLNSAFCILLAVLASPRECMAAPPATDYCEMLARDIAGKQHGFLAGNHLYYVGGAASDTWRITEHETLGFTHPLFRDGRARGHGIVPSAGGTGHDQWGWEFWRKVRAAYGSVIVNGKKYEHPRPESIIWRPDRQVCVYRVGDVRIDETKFISRDDVLCAIVTADAPVTMEFRGRSFINSSNIPTHDGDPEKTRFSIRSTANAVYDVKNNAIHVTEGGTIWTKPDFGSPARPGRLMYDGMSTVISASCPLAQSCVIDKNEDGSQGYTFQVECTPGRPLVLAYAMGDDYARAVQRVRQTLARPDSALAAKTEHLNDLLNRQIPYFRCSDEKVVQVYYYLWSLYFMYFTHDGEGWEKYPHTQTAVNNFMGLHLWDSWAYTAMGAWVVDKWQYGHGNILSWQFLLPFRSKVGALPDNFGIAWFTPSVRMNLVGAVEMAWQQFEQSGDRRFLDEVYHKLFRPLYWNGPQSSFGIEINALDTLVKMAEQLGQTDDVSHWQAMRAPMVTRFRSVWEAEYPHYYVGKGARIKDIWQLASMMCVEMPDDWARAMVRHWVMNTETGFIGPVPLDIRPPNVPENGVFAVSSISTWLAAEGMFRRGCPAEAVYCTLRHVNGMVRDFGYPIAPECWDPDYRPWGSMYYNWDGAIIPLLIQRLAGIRYSIPDRKFTVSDHLPDEWQYVETHTPIVIDGKTTWTKVRMERRAGGKNLTKVIRVENCPLDNLIVEPWLEDRELVASNPPPATPGREYASFHFQGQSSASISLTLGRRQRESNTLAYLTPHGCEFDDAITVQVQNLQDGTTLRYTVDGSEPTQASRLCDRPMIFAESTTLKIRAFSGDGTVYRPMEATYRKKPARHRREK